jgi:hypothetical protein
MADNGENDESAALYRFVLPTSLFTHSSHSSNLDMSDDDEDVHSTLLSFVPPTLPGLGHNHCLACPLPRILQAASCTTTAMVCTPWEDDSDQHVLMCSSAYAATSRTASSEWYFDLDPEYHSYC